MSCGTTLEIQEGKYAGKESMPRDSETGLSGSLSGLDFDFDFDLILVLVLS